MILKTLHLSRRVIAKMRRSERIDLYLRCFRDALEQFVLQQRSFAAMLGAKPAESPEAQIEESVREHAPLGWYTPLKALEPGEED